MPPTHWTYENVGSAEDLSQGDYLSPTPELQGILRQIHAHFCNDKYVGFVIATQTCDLVRRGGAECAARYISIAAVRTLYSVLPRLVATIEGATVKENVFRSSKKSRAAELLERVVDQNEQSLGLFYLHEDSDLGIGDPSVAYLRVTVALRAEHYPVLLGSRRGRLKPEFQAKLGWLLGNLYARPATTEWLEQPDGDGKRREVVDRFLKSRNLQWVDDKSLDQFAGEQPNYAQLPADEIVKEVRRRKPVRTIDEVVDVVTQIANRRVASVLEARLKTFEHHVSKIFGVASRSDLSPADSGPAPDGASENALRDGVVEKAREHLCHRLTTKEATQLETDLKSESRLKQLVK